jgi:hypothetical protein
MNTTQRTITLAMLAIIATLNLNAQAAQMENTPENASKEGSSGAWLKDTYWCVPTAYLPALLAITSGPTVVTVSDQTVWHILKYSKGYISGVSATNIGVGWSYMLMVGSVAPDGTVKISFSPLGGANPKDPTTQVITIGDGTFHGRGAHPAFLMQMTSGTASASVTHWARMVPVTPGDPEWQSLPGYPATGVPDLASLGTTVAFQ